MLTRKAVEEDFESISLLYNQVNQLHVEKLPHIFQQPKGTAIQENYYLGLINTHNSIIFVAVENGQIIGFINVLIRVSSDIPQLVPRCYAIIENIFVDWKHRNKEVGKALMNHAQKWALDMGAEEIELTVYEFNRSARSFYEKLGYKTQSRRLSLKTRE